MKKLGDENVGARENSQVTFAIEALFSEKSIADIGWSESMHANLHDTTGEEEKRGRI